MKSLWKSVVGKNLRAHSIKSRLSRARAKLKYVCGLNLVIGVIEKRDEIARTLSVPNGI
jgi:hypothetical protein